jgi:rhodanese-related sulfurtransferase
MSRETTDTLGHQKMTNYALRAGMTRDEFVKEVLEGLVEPPQYFPANVLMNLRGGIESVDDILKKGNRGWNAREFEAARDSLDALVIDTRSKEDFTREHIPDSVFIGLDDNFAPWVGTLVTDLKQPILFIADEGREAEVVTRLARVGYDNSLGYLAGGIDMWKEAGYDTARLEEISAADFASLYQSSGDKINLLDARRHSEFESEHIIGAINFPLDFVNQQMSELDRNKRYYIHCAGGYRSVILASILKARGFEKLVNIRGGFKALSQTSLKRSHYKAPVTQL